MRCAMSLPAPTRSGSSSIPTARPRRASTHWRYGYSARSNDSFDLSKCATWAREHRSGTTETVIENAVRRWERIIGENGATSGLIITTSQWKCRDIVPLVRRLHRRFVDLRLPPRPGWTRRGAGGPASCARRKRMAYRGCRSWAPCGVHGAARDRSRARLRYASGTASRLPAGPSRRYCFTGAGHPLQRQTGHRRL